MGKSSLEYYSLDDLIVLAQTGFTSRKLSAGSIHDLQELRLSGLSLLQRYKRSLIAATDQDKDWYYNETTKPLVYKKKICLSLIGKAPKDPRTHDLDISEASAYFKKCRKEEKDKILKYIADFGKELREKYPLDVSEWFKYWYYVWGEHDIEVVELDWSIYFSHLNPRLPGRPQVKFSWVIHRLNTIERAEAKPFYLEYCWEDRDIRAKMLRGDPINHHGILICPYSTVLSYICRMQERLNRRVGTLAVKLYEEGLPGADALDSALEQFKEEY